MPARPLPGPAPTGRAPPRPRPTPPRVGRGPRPPAAPRGRDPSARSPPCCSARCRARCATGGAAEAGRDLPLPSLLSPLPLSPCSRRLSASPCRRPMGIDKGMGTGPERTPAPRFPESFPAASCLAFLPGACRTGQAEGGSLNHSRGQKFAFAAPAGRGQRTEKPGRGKGRGLPGAVKLLLAPELPAVGGIPGCPRLTGGLCSAAKGVSKLQ